MRPLVFLSALLIATLALSYAVKAPFQPPKIELSRDLRESVVGFRHLVRNGETFNPETCSRVLADIYQSIYPLDPEHYLPMEEESIRRANIGQLNEALLSKNPLHGFFGARLLLRKKFAEWVRRGEFENYEQLMQCADALKVAMRTLRTFEDYMGQVLLEEQGFFAEGKSVKKFEDNLWPHTMIEPKYKENYVFPHSAEERHHSLQSGDVLLSRGNMFTGAVIARIGNIDNQFSHLAMVYIADGSIETYIDREKQEVPFVPGNVYVVEAMLDNGLQVGTLEDYLKESKARVVHFRYRGNGHQSEDRLGEIRAMAARKLAEKAATAQISYNFSMDMSDTSQLFCSQAVAYGYQMACEAMNEDCHYESYSHPRHGFPFPLVSTVFEKADGKFINPLANELGLKETHVFSPADVDIDPQLELVAEWRDYSSIEGRRIHDMVLTKVFQWMEQGGYVFKNSEFMKHLGSVGQVLAVSMGMMPENTPASYAEKTMLLAYLIEKPGLSKAKRAAIRRALNAVSTIAPSTSGSTFSWVRETMEQALGTGVIDGVDDQTLKVFIQAISSLSEEGRLDRVLKYSGLGAQMKSFSGKYREKYGFPPTDYVYDLALEKLRGARCAAHKKGEDEIFHKVFAQGFSEEGEGLCEEAPLDWRNVW